MTELENSIVKAQEAYYNGTPIMSDGMFDELWDKLKREQPDSELLKEVGADHMDGFTKVKHDMIMGSQEKANTEEEMDKFIESTDGKKYIGQFKMDGGSIALSYVCGTFVRAATRGDGVEGDDITDNALKMNGLIREIDSNFTGSIRGEVLMSRANKEKYFPDKANCRNAGNGVMKHKDGADCDKLDIVVYDAQAKDGSDYFNTQENMQNWLSGQGFKVAPWKMFNKLTGKECIEYLNEVFDMFDDLEYDIDGIVWKQDVIDIEDFKTNTRPKTNIALKPARTYATSVLRDVLWECKNGTYTPVAVFDPVQLNGTTVVHASLVNVMRMEQLGIEIGHEVTICKTGMIIPKIVKNNTTGKFAEGYEF